MATIITLPRPLLPLGFAAALLASLPAQAAEPSAQEARAGADSGTGASTPDAPAPIFDNDEGGIDRPAPDFVAYTYDGRKVSLADFRGKVLIINFWATWCVPCRTELPLLDAYYALRKKAGLEVIAVATEDSVPQWQLQELAGAVHFPFIERMKGPYHYLDGVPTNFVIDRKGVLRYAQAAAFDLAAMNELLVPLLREPAPDTPQSGH